MQRGRVIVRLVAPHFVFVHEVLGLQELGQRIVDLLFVCEPTPDVLVFLIDDLVLF